MKKKVIVLGASGMAGHVIALELRKQPHAFEVISVSRTSNLSVPDIMLDVTDLEGVRDMLQQQMPDVIINCVGTLNQVAENDPATAILLNSYLPHYLRDLAKDTNARLIHISTDCVFSGEKGGYIETDIKDGQGYYAQTKALGEVINDKDLTIRTSIVGPELKGNGIGLFNWFAKQNGTINGFTQAYWTGVTTPVLAKAIILLIDQQVTGLYHLVPGEKIAKFSLLKIFLQTFNKSKVTEIIASDNYKTDKSLLNTRSDHQLNIPDYKVMVEELKIWMTEHKELYPHYADIL